MLSEKNMSQTQIEYCWIRQCAVPLCPNNDDTAPHKLYITVPTKAEWRQKWLDLAQCDDVTRAKTLLYFCEDHFDMPNDMQNYEEYCRGGTERKIFIMTYGCIPSKFVVQRESKKRSLSPSETQSNKDARLEHDPLSHDNVLSRINILQGSRCINENLKTRKSHWCIVPRCPNHNETEPRKLFISVPSNPETRKKWMELARIDEATLELPTGKIIYFCEDHFDLQNDMVAHHQKNGVKNYIRMKSGCIPSKFDCQERHDKIIYPRIRQTADSGTEMVLVEDSEFVSVIGTHGSILCDAQDVFEEECPQDDDDDDDDDDVQFLSDEEPQSFGDNLEDELSVESSSDSADSKKLKSKSTQIETPLEIEQTSSTEDEAVVKLEKIAGEDDYSYYVVLEKFFGDK